MSAQSDAIKTPTDDWRVRSALKPKERYEAADFPNGKLIVGESRLGWRSGRVGYALCEVIDAYPSKARRFSTNGLCIFARVIASHDEYLAHMVGHVVELGLAARGHWYSEVGLRVTTIPPKQMFPA